jgi:peptidoglycan/xylan/chitin deacetylase (PgdA/CDA1 family)
VRAGTGPYFAIVDGAEHLDGRYLQNARTLLDETPDRAFAAAPGLQGGAVGQTDGTIDLPCLLASPWAVSATALVRREAFERVGGFDERLPDLADWDLLLTLVEAGLLGAVVRSVAVVRHPTDDIRLRETLRADRHLPSVRRIFLKHTPSFERFAPRVLSDREAGSRALWVARGQPLAAERDRLHAELSDVTGRLQRTHAELSALGSERFDWNDLRRTTPLSYYWGLERGRPIDRHYIEGFIAAHAEDVQGEVLEVLDNVLTRAHGGGRVIRSDVLDIDASNHRATVIADLRLGTQLPEEAYDCFILTQTLHLIDDMTAALASAHRALKPGGVLLATLPCLSMVAQEYGAEGDHWRVTEAGARRLFEQVFAPESVQTQARGNVLAAAAFLYGLSCEELSLEELEQDDPAFPLVVLVRAVKAPEAPAVRRARSPRRGSAILLYHQVAARTPDSHGLAIEPEVFRSQLLELCRGWQPVSLSALAEAAVAGDPPDECVALTFDDGYLDNLTHAAPVLAELDVPATFFVTAEKLDAKRFFWWDYLEQLVCREGSTPLTLRVENRVETFAMATPTDRRVTHDRLYAICKSALPAVRDELLRQLVDSGAVTAPLGAGRPMISTELQAVCEFPRIDIGAHGVHHVTLAGLSADHLQREVFESRTALERVTGRTVELFAYPYGDVTPEAVEMVRAADYRFAVTCDPRGIGRREAASRLPRLESPRVGGSSFADWLTQAAAAARQRVS